jgi:hypothetical protein
MKPKWMASAKPNEHKVFVKKNVYTYSNVQKYPKKIHCVSDDMTYYLLMRQVAKVVLRTVKEVVRDKK